MKTMIGIMKRTVAVALCLLLSAPYALAAEVGKVTYVEGRVDVVRQGSQDARPVVAGESLSVGDAIRTKSNSKAELAFNDKTVVRVAQNSKVSVDDYQLTPANERKSATITLDRGKVRTIIAKMHQPADFNIKTPNASGTVKGSDVYAFFQAGNSGMLVSEGNLSILNTAHPDSVVAVPAGSAILIPQDESPKAPRQYLELEKRMYDQDTYIPPVAAKKENESSIRASVSKFSGDVKITSKRTKETRAATVGDIVGEGDYIKTGANGIVSILLDNGNEISLKPNTDLTITKLAMDMKTGEYQNLFETNMGTIKARIEKLKGQSRFEVKTPTAVSGARGTIMYVEVSPASTKVFFEGGFGYVKNLISNLQKTVDIGEKATSDNSGGVSDPVPVNDQERMDWGSGWDPSSGIEGYSAPAGGGVGVLLNQDQNTGALTLEGTTDLGGMNGEEDVPFDQFNPPDQNPPADMDVTDETANAAGAFNSGVRDYYGDEYDNVFDGTFNTVGSPWGGQTAEFLAAGDLAFGPDGSFVWNTAPDRAADLPVKLDPSMTTDGGAFAGFAGGIGGVFNGLQILDGFFKLIYIDPDGNAGIASGDAAGIFDGYLGAFLLGSELTGVQKATASEVGITPDRLMDSLYISEEGGGTLSSGGLTDGSYEIAGFDDYTMRTLSLVDADRSTAQQWGVYTHTLRGQFSGEVPNDWRARLGGEDSFGARNPYRYAYAQYSYPASEGVNPGYFYYYINSNNYGNYYYYRYTSGYSYTGVSVSYQSDGMVYHYDYGTGHSWYTTWDPTTQDIRDLIPTTPPDAESAVRDYGSSGTGAYDDWGYWIADVLGTRWQDGIFGADVMGKFITRTKLGTINGRIVGAFDEYGRWQAAGLGDWEQTVPLRSSSYAHAHTAGYRYDYGYGEYWTDDCAFSSIFGTPDSMWDGGSPRFTMMGELSRGEGEETNNGRFAWLASNVYKSNYDQDYNLEKFFEGGGYGGKLAGLALADEGRIFGTFLGIYMDDKGNLGRLRIGLDGNLYADSGLFEMSGNAFLLEQIVPAGDNPMTLEEFYRSLYYSYGDGSAAGGSRGDGWMLSGDERLQTMSIVDYARSHAEPWGIYAHQLSGTYAGAMGNGWHAEVGGYDPFGVSNPAQYVYKSYDYDDGRGSYQFNYYTDNRSGYAYYYRYDVDEYGNGTNVRGYQTYFYSDGTYQSYNYATDEWEYGTWSGSISDYISDAAPDSGETHLNSYSRENVGSADYAYWIAHVSGTKWDGRELAADVRGRFMTRTKIGTMNGEIYGVYDGEGFEGEETFGDWQAVGIGSWDAVPLQYSAEMSASTYYGDDCFGYADLYAYVGSTDSLLDDGAAITAIGSYEGDGGPLTWYGDDIRTDSERGEELSISETTDGVGGTGVYAIMAGAVSKLSDISALFAALYIDEDGNAGTLFAGLQGKAYPEIGLFELDSIGLESAEMAQGLTISSDNFSVWGNSGDGRLIGGRSSERGSISGEEDLMTYAFVDYGNQEAQPWGIYGQIFHDGRFTEPVSDGWTAKMGGNDPFGAYRYTSYYYDWWSGYVYEYSDMSSDYGYWMADITDGMWSEDGTIAARLSGRFLTQTKMGRMNGEILGVYENDLEYNYDTGEEYALGQGAWEAVGAGTWSGESLTLSGSWNSESGEPTCLYGLYDEDGYGYAESVGEDFGLVGSTAQCWGTQSVFPVLAMGAYYGSAYDGPRLWSSMMQSYDAIYDDASTIDGGSFFAATTGIFSSKLMRGSAAGIYLYPAADGSLIMGTMVGRLSGEYVDGLSDYTYYDDYGLWQADGVFTTAVMRRDTSDAYDTDYQSVNRNYGMSAEVYDEEYGGSDYGYYIEGYGSGYTAYAPYENWGIYSLIIGDENSYYKPHGSRTFGSEIYGYARFGNYRNAGLMKGDIYCLYNVDGEDEGGYYGSWMSSGVGVWSAQVGSTEYAEWSGEYRGFIGGVMNPDGTAFGEMVAVYAQDAEYGFDGGGFGIGDGMAVGFFNGGGAMSVDAFDGGAISVYGQDWGVWGARMWGTYENPTDRFMMIFLGDALPDGYDMESTGSDVFWFGVVTGFRDKANDVLKGFFRGVLYETGEEEGHAFDLLKGDFLAALSPDSETTGSWDGIAMGDYRTQGYTEMAIDNIGDFSSLIETSGFEGTGVGAFLGGGSIIADHFAGTSFAITDQMWGVWIADMAGEYNGLATTVFNLALGAPVTDMEGGSRGYMLTTVNGSLLAGELSGALRGVWLSPGDEPGMVRAGKITGDVSGYVDVDDVPGTWQAVSAGEWVEVTDILDENILFGPEGLSRLGDFVSVPITEVHAGLLTGTGAFNTGGAINAAMDISFYATSAAALDGVWAALINGTFTPPGTPAAGANPWSVTVTGNGGDTATLTGTQWDANQWQATVSGTTGAGANFSGQAAGTYTNPDPAGQGTLTGVGAGTWQQQTPPADPGVPAV